MERILSNNLVAEIIKVVKAYNDEKPARDECELAVDETKIGITSKSFIDMSLLEKLRKIAITFNKTYDIRTGGNGVMFCIYIKLAIF